MESDKGIIAYIEDLEIPENVDDEIDRIRDDQRIKLDEMEKFYGKRIIIIDAATTARRIIGRSIDTMIFDEFAEYPLGKFERAILDSSPIPKPIQPHGPVRKGRGGKIKKW